MWGPPSASAKATADHRSLGEGGRATHVPLRGNQPSSIPYRPSHMQRLAAVLLASVLLAAPASAQSVGQRIQEASFLTIGGIEQWVTIRGDDRRNPLLLLLHGGPADVQSPLVSTYAPYEKDFVLVQWD